MTKRELTTRTERLVGETHDALATIFNELNHGQQQKLLKNEEIKKLLERYGVIEG